jgi:5-methylcytosine-specific restriction endonuclease McrA
MSKWSDPDFVREYNRQYRAKHLERERQRSRDYAKAHSVEAVERVRAWRDKTKHARLAGQASRRAARKVAAKRRAVDRVQQWRKDNPEKAAHSARNYCHRRRAKYTDPSMAWGAWMAIKEDYGHRCAYCAALPAKLEQDHMDPLAIGGRHNSANVVPACRRCNASKGDTPLLLWLAR